MPNANVGTIPNATVFPSFFVFTKLFLGASCSIIKIDQAAFLPLSSLGTLTVTFTFLVLNGSNSINVGEIFIHLDNEYLPSPGGKKLLLPFPFMSKS